MRDMKITMDELLSIIGAKEVELFAARKEVERTRAVLAQVTAPREKGDGTEEGSSDDAPSA